jgi:hypothetical protein
MENRGALTDTAREAVEGLLEEARARPIVDNNRSR